MAVLAGPAGQALLDDLSGQAVELGASGHSISRRICRPSASPSESGRPAAPTGSSSPRPARTRPAGPAGTSMTRFSTMPEAELTMHHQGPARAERDEFDVLQRLFQSSAPRRARRNGTGPDSMVAGLARAPPVDAAAGGGALTLDVTLPVVGRSGCRAPGFRARRAASPSSVGRRPAEVWGAKSKPELL